MPSAQLYIVFEHTEQVSAHGMPIVQPDLNGEIATTIHIAHISHR